MKKGVVIHTRDLRLQDNRTINKAYEKCDEILHVFILNPKQIQGDNDSNKDFGLNVYAIEFMHQSLEDLNEELQKNKSQLIILHDYFIKSLDTIKNDFNFESIFISKDYSPFAITRENELEKYCREHSIYYEKVEEYLLLDDSSNYLKPQNQEPYTVFTPFYNNAIKTSVQLPQEITHYKCILTDNISNNLKEFSKKSFEKLNSLYHTNSKKAVLGGRKNGFIQLKNLEEFDYKELRNYPYLDKTTKLSAHIKFGTLSLREIYYSIFDSFKEKGVELLRQLYWHDFFTLIAKHFPHVFKESFQKQYVDVKWINDLENEHFKLWCEGQTGFPIVDAAMRELNTTGYMHNRCRMIVASFLTKDLHINWQLGERYFASKLIDYDSCVNNGSWQWAASIGCDAQPYFRIFNPWLQQLKFDEKCEYIKKWVPELSKVESKAIHHLDTQRPLFPQIIYPRPIVNHKIQAEKAKELFKVLR